MSQTNSSQCPIPTPVPFNKRIWALNAYGLQELLVVAALPAVLYGVFTILFSASIYSLIRRSDISRIPIIALALTLLALFTSTTVYFVYTLLATQSRILNSFLFSPLDLWALSFGILEMPGPDLFKDYTLAQQCAGTIGLTVNILLGDAIVCWRTCVLWQRSRIVTAMCVAFLLTTFGLGVVDSIFTCYPSQNVALDPHADGTGTMYSGVSSGVAASVLSFGTNFGSTLLVGYKAWVSRRFIRKHVIAGSLGRQTERVLALLVESGVLYCLFWAVVVAWQIGSYQESIEANAGIYTFWDVFDVLIQGALVPLIAIYPTIIIILVALNRSQVEHGFEHDDGPRFPNPTRLPLRTLTVTIGSVTAEQDDDPHGTGLHDIGPYPLDSSAVPQVLPSPCQDPTTTSELVQKVSARNPPRSMDLTPLTSHVRGGAVSWEPMTP